MTRQVIKIERDRLSILDVGKNLHSNTFALVVTELNVVDGKPKSKDLY